MATIKQTSNAMVALTSVKLATIHQNYAPVAVKTILSKINSVYHVDRNFKDALHVHR